MNPDKAAIEKLWEKHSFDYHEPGVRDPVRVMIKDDFLAALSEAEGERWISVQERMPDTSKAVLVRCCDRQNTYTASWRVPYWIHFGGYGNSQVREDVHYWQPLPAPPKEKP